MPMLREKYAVSELGVFGSFVRGEQREGSDVDLLVSFSKTPDLFDFVELKFLLSDLLGREVDLVMRGALSRRPLIAPMILNEVLAV